MCSVRDVACFSKASVYLLQQFKGKFKSCAEEFIEVFILTLSLVMKLLALYITVCQGSPDLLALINLRKSKVLDSVSDALTDWLSSCIGGTVFGGKVANTADKSVVFDKPGEEFEVSIEYM